MEISKILILSKDKPNEVLASKLASILRVKTGDKEATGNFWNIQTKYYKATIEIVNIEFVYSFIEDELKELGKVDCIIYELLNEENAKEFFECVDKLQEIVCTEASIVLWNSNNECSE